MLQSRVGLKVRTILFSLTLFFLLGHIFVSIITHEIPGVQAKSDFDYPDLNPMASMDLGMDIEEPNPSEIGMENGKRFKLYEKKKLNHEKAKKFCKKREGRLAQAKNVDEMRRLQSLLMKARLIAGEIWVGADKKEWKKYSSKMLGGMNMPDLGPHAMMMGGGPTEMCPALSSSTRSLTPAACYKELPFVCEYEPGKGKVKVKAKDKTVKKESQPQSQTKSANARRIKSPKRDEMKRRKREIVPLVEVEGKSGSTEQTPSTTAEMTLNSEMETSTPTLAPEALQTSSGTEFPSEVITTTENSAAAAAHVIGFIPHIVHSKRKENAGITRMKLSTKLMLADESVIEQIDNSISSSTSSTNEGENVREPTFLGDTVQLTSESDPDQAMVDLINEQTELQSLETMILGLGMNLSVQSGSAATATDTNSYMKDEYMSTMSVLEGRSLDENETNDTVAGQAEPNRKPKPDKRAGKETAKVMAELIGNSPLQLQVSESTEEAESHESVSERTNEPGDEFQSEPMVNASQSLLEPTITIELSSREGRDNLQPKRNDKTGTVGTPGPLLSPMSNSTSNASKSNAQPVRPEIPKTPTTSTTTTTREVPAPPMQGRNQEITSTTTKMPEITTTAKANTIARSITSATMRPTHNTTMPSMKAPTQETQETTSANTPSTSQPSISTSSLKEKSPNPTTTTTNLEALQLSTESGTTVAVKGDEMQQPATTSKYRNLSF